MVTYKCCINETAPDERKVQSEVLTQNIGAPSDSEMETTTNLTVWPSAGMKFLRLYLYNHIREENVLEPMKGLNTLP